METYNIRNFLSKLTDIDYRYLRIQCSMANDARTLIKEYHLTKTDFCDLMQIAPLDYELYLNGGFNYDIEKMALMQAAFINLNRIKYEKELKGTITDIITEDGTNKSKPL